MPKFWRSVLEFGLVLWVVRVPLLSTLTGLLILSLAPQAQDLFLDWISPKLDAPPFGTAWIGFWVSWIWERIAKPFLFLVFLFAVWAAPVHYTARILLDRDQRYQDCRRSRSLEIATPRILGHLAFVAVFSGLYRAWRHLPTSGDEQLLASAKWELAGIAAGTCAAMLLFQMYVWGRMGYVRAQRAALTSKADRNPSRFYRMRLFLVSPSSGILYLALVSVTSVMVIMIGAAETSRLFSRALALPLILGGWLPLLTLASHYGRRLRIPIITLSVATVAALTWILGDNHTVRRYPDSGAPTGSPGALNLKDALDLWKGANCQSGPGQPGTEGSGQSCPRPLIVAAAGGASRAAFFTASALGFLFDLTSPEDGSTPRKWDATRVRNRLFAISAVSGGSIGAAMTVAALKDAPDGRSPPCRLPVRPGESWFGREIGDWRDCLEAMLAGDFLTPVVIGLSFHDMLPFIPWPDRAVLLEKAWEDRYANLVEAGVPRRMGRCVGLSCPFASFRPEKEAWLPLLIMNGTSVTTGQRIVTTILAPEYEKPLDQACPVRNLDPTGTQKESCRIFPETYRFHDFLIDNGNPDAHSWFLGRAVADLQARIAERSGAAEIRLSTAALNSARFPVISPAGEIRNARNRVIDRIVDGGYFENYGASSALDLARAIKTLDPSLDPFVLVISNDPEASVDLEQLIPRADRRHVTGLLFPDVPKGGFASAVTSPITAFANTRNARRTLAVGQLRAELRLLNDIPDEDRNVAHLRVAPQIESPGQFRPLSMSWWLSKPVQARLHEQVECDHNKEELAELLKILDVKVDLPEKKCDQQVAPER